MDKRIRGTEVVARRSRNHSPYQFLVVKVPFLLRLQVYQKEYTVDRVRASLDDSKSIMLQEVNLAGRSRLHMRLLGGIDNAANDDGGRRVHRVTVQPDPQP